MKVKSLRLHSYAGKYRPRGDVYEMSESDYKLLKFLSCVEKYTEPVKEEPKVKEEQKSEEKPKRPKKTYQRRDMKAEK